MAILNSTSGIVSLTQISDSTGIRIHDTGFSQSVALPSETLVLDRFGNRIPVETKRDKLEAIRKKSHMDLGGAWSRLAEM